MDFYFLHIIFVICMCESNALSVQERLEELERVVALQAVQLEKHEHVTQDQKWTNDQYEKENNLLKMRVKVLEDSISGSGLGRIESINSQPYGEKKLKAENGNEGIVDDNDTGDVSMKAIGARDTHMMKRQAENVAFHVYMTGKTCIHDHEVLVFDEETLDSGNGYNNQDGIYVVPDSGTYVFTWVASARGQEWYQAEIVINGQAKSWIVADSITDTEDVCGTGIVVENVNAGDHVFIRKLRGNGCAQPPTHSRTSFSGWKLS